jgi:hypothetical protein
MAAADKTRSKAVPIRRSERKSLSIPRVPLEGALTPRLQRWGLPDAIGFRLRSAEADRSAEDRDSRHRRARDR